MIVPILCRWQCREEFDGGLFDVRSAARVKQDYAGWKALGPGGLPANPVGWAVTKALTPLGRDALNVGGSIGGGSGWELPQRRGPRPSVAPYPIPHRQSDGIPDSGPILMSDVVASYARERPDRFLVERSHFEKRGDALYVAEKYRKSTPVKKARGEIAHVHSSDGSLHVVADHADAQQIIDAGWGELHPLAGRPLIGLPESYVLLYSPRDDVDVAQVSSILNRIVETALGSPRQ